MIKVYALKDLASQTTNNPFFAPTHRDAIESLKQVANDETTNIGKYPQDFELYCLGDYDPRAMSFALSDSQELLVRADALASKENNN